MSLIEEATRSVTGAWRIARLDPQAMRYFNLTIDGFWRSFLAPAVLAPFYVGVSMVAPPSAVAAFMASDPVSFLLVQLLFVVISMATLPLVMIPLSMVLGLTAGYVPFIIASNWSMIVVSVVMIPVALIVTTQVLGPDLGNLIFVMALISVLYYGYLVTRASLGCNVSTAIGIVVLDFLLGRLIDRGAYELIYAASGG